MKTIRKLITLLAVLSLFFSLSAPMAVPVAAVTTASQEELLYFGRSILEKMNNGQALCYAYDKLVDGLNNRREYIDISHRTYEIDCDEAATVERLVEADHPEFFWINYVAYGGNGDVITYFEVHYDTTELAYLSAVEQRVQQLTAGLEEKSDYEKSLILHDRLCDAVMYQFSEHNQTVIGSLALGASVCAGYARGYQILLQAVGIPCFYVTGYSRDQSHAWNLVQLDGQWYYTDVTWDDQNDNGGDIYYAYLNNTYQQISEDHTAVDFAEYLPKSTATANNYYVKNGLLLDPSQPLDVEKLAMAFKENYPPQLYCLGENVQEGAVLIFNNLNKIVREMMGEDYDFSANAGLLGHGLVIHLVIDHPHQYKTETVAPSCLVGGTVTNRCDDCGHTTKETIPATGHDLTITWHDDTHHGKQCSRCGLIDNLEEHVYDNDRDADCNTCGREREVVSVIPGDANGDGKVNNRDLGILQQYLNDQDVFVDPTAADINGDGKVNNRDLGLLQRQLNE